MRHFVCSFLLTILSSSGLSFAGKNPQEHIETQEASASFSLIQALERDHLPVDQSSFLAHLGSGIRAQKARHFQEAIASYAHAARYGDPRPFKAMAECYAELEEWVSAFKWMAWALQEMPEENSSYRTPRTQAIAFLNSPENRLALKRECTRTHFHQNLFKKWKTDYETVQWDTQWNNIQKLEPYLTKQEVASKKSFFQHRLLARSDTDLFQEYTTLQESPRLENFFKELKRVNTPLCWEILGIGYWHLKRFAQAYPWFEKASHHAGGIEKFIQQRAHTYPDFFLAFANTYENFDPNNPSGGPAYDRSFHVYSMLCNAVEDARFYLNLGVHYEFGYGCEANPTLAFEWAQKSLNCMLRAQMPHFSGPYYNLGTYYLHGTGISENYDLARTYLEKAVDMGEAAACTNLASMYINGLGVPRDYNKAIDLYAKAAELGDLSAKISIAEILIQIGLVNQTISSEKQQQNLEFEKARMILESVQALGDPRGSIQRALISFYGDGDIQKGLDLAENAISLLRTENVNRAASITILQNVIHMYLKSEGKIFLSREDIYARILKLQTMQSTFFLPTENGKKAYYQSLTAYYKKEYALALDCLNQAYIQRYTDDYLDMFPAVRSLLKKAQKETKVASQKVLQEKQDMQKIHKANKKSAKMERKRAKIDAIITHNLSNQKVVSKKEETPRALEILFKDEATQALYDDLTQEGSKLAECIEAIREGNPWETTGIGKPEVLKGSYGGHKGIISRRLDDFNRLTYVVEGPGQIRILGCQGHYGAHKRE